MGGSKGETQMKKEKQNRKINPVRNGQKRIQTMVPFTAGAKSCVAVIKNGTFLDLFFWFASVQNRKMCKMKGSKQRKLN